MRSPTSASENRVYGAGKIGAEVDTSTFSTEIGHERTHALQQIRGGWELLLSGVQLVEQRLRLLQIERVEAFSEPAVDRSEKIAGLIRLTLIAS